MEEVSEVAEGQSAIERLKRNLFLSHGVSGRVAEGQSAIERLKRIQFVDFATSQGTVAEGQSAIERLKLYHHLGKA